MLGQYSLYGAEIHYNVTMSDIHHHIGQHSFRL